MFENKFFSAQTYTNTAIERSWKFSPMLFSGSYCLGCRVQCSSSSLADSVDRSDRSSDLFNKPVWTKLNELPDSLSQKNWSLCICIYIYLFLEQSNYHEYHGKLAYQTFPSARLKSLKYLTKELRSWEKYFSFRLIHLHKTYHMFAHNFAPPLYLWNLGRDLGNPW